MKNSLQWIFNDEAFTGFDVLLEQSEEEDGEGGEGDVVEGQVDPVVQGLWGVAVEEGEEELSREGSNVLVEEILQQINVQF